MAIQNINGGCLTKAEITKNNGQVINNTDGSVSVFYNNATLGLYPVPLTLTCCKVLDPTYYFDIDTQTCKWSNVSKTCGFSNPINLIVNPKGDDGTLFFIDNFEQETCNLKISFDYLLKIKCEDLLNLVNPTITTNYANATTQVQINTTQQLIEEYNTQIETLTNNIVLTNTESLVTPYSIECLKFPIITINSTPIDCVTSAWSTWSTCTNSIQTRTRTIITPASNGGIGCPVLTETQPCSITTPTTYCPSIVGNFSPPLDSSIKLNPIQGSGGYAYGTNTITYIGSQPFNGTLYWYATAQSSYPGLPEYPDFGNAYKTQLNLLPGQTFTLTAGGFTESNVTVNAEKIVCSSSIPTTSLQLAKTTNNFENTGFNINTTTDKSIIQPVNTTTYSSVNYCLTDYGLTIWANLLGPIKYEQFILGDSNSYTCDDVATIVNQTWPNGEAVYVCTVPFGTKTKLNNQLTDLMSQLILAQAKLLEQENILINLESTLLTTTTSNTGCLTPTQALESLDFEMHLDVINDDKSLTSVFSAATFPAINLTSNLYNYLTTSGASGFYICGDPSNTDIGLSACTTLSLNNGPINTPNVSSCNKLIDGIYQSLFVDYTGKTNSSDYTEFLKTLSNDALASNWLTYSTLITDPAIIKLITNKKIKISLRINYSCVDFCILLDNIVLDKSCEIVDKHDIIISKNPGFELKRVIDNKKSWSDSSVSTNRNFLIAKSDSTNPFRQTNYDVNDERLVINSKEIDLDISIASAIETDVWTYLKNNTGFLTGLTTCNPCTDFTKDFQDDECFIFMDNLAYNFMDGGISNGSGSICCGDNVSFANLITTDLSTIKTIDNFENLMVSELIDVKNRQTISSYPTLRAIYERYVTRANGAFDYVTMDKFSHLIGSYWVDIIEQVVPSTAIWGSVKIYTNTIFDEQKFKYKEYTALICDTTFTELNKTNHIKGIFCDGGDVEINTTIITTATTVNSILKYTNCTTIYLAQMNAGSEFIGKVEKH